eukprot:CAMPEP_0174829614 /NCGR_PEP_ID=MMETSP1114-20130205/2025_1 /TAXON_ID=312471 /ORGANISM="Neobodo designis, Strain CCAP 1951/1" /LENGTH=99 /DNA_ID=CAMNT_0016063367 /DNA_START=970 /DNA_END=1267 /DNA_ORIENTATION=+
MEAEAWRECPPGKGGVGLLAAWRASCGRVQTYQERVIVRRRAGSRYEALTRQETARLVDVAAQQRNEAWGEKKQGGRGSEMGTGGALAQAVRITTASYG